MNKRFLKVLIAVNVVLMAGLALVSVTEAQGVGAASSEFSRPGKYLIIPADSNVLAEDVVYIMDQRTGKMAALKYRGNQNRGEFEIIKGRNVQGDVSRLP